MGKAGRVQERRRGNPDERKTFEKTLTKLKEKLLGQTILQTQRTPTEGQEPLVWCTRQLRL